MVSHFFSPLRSLKKKARGRLGNSTTNSWSDSDEECYGDDSNTRHDEMSPSDTQKSKLVTGRCMCCGNKVTYPPHVSCYKCTICDTVNDLKPLVRTEKVVVDGQVKSKPRTAPPPLTLERLKAGVHAFKKSPEKQNLLEAMIRESFGNWDVLNSSFANGNPTSTDDPGISLSEVRTAYKIILGLPPIFIRAMMNGVEQILRRPGRPLVHREDIRFLLIIIENPLLLQQNFPQESSYHHHIVKSIVGIVANLPNRIHYALVLWISQYSPSSLKRKIKLINQFISYRLEKYNRARKRNQAQRAVPLTSYTSRSNQTVLPAFQRTRSITHGARLQPSRDSGKRTIKREVRHGRMRSNTHTPSTKSPTDSNVSSSRESPLDKPETSTRAIASSTTFTTDIRKTTPPLPVDISSQDRQQNHIEVRSGFQSDAEYNDIGGISTINSQDPNITGVDNSNTADNGGLGIDVGDNRPKPSKFPFLGSTPPDTLQLRSRHALPSSFSQQSSPDPTKISPNSIRIPEVAKIESDRRSFRYRSKTIGSLVAAEGVNSAVGSHSVSGERSPNSVPWPLTKDGKGVSDVDITSPPPIFARSSPSPRGGIDDQMVPVRNTSKILLQREHGGDNISTTSFIPLKGPSTPNTQLGSSSNNDNATQSKPRSRNQAAVPHFHSMRESTSRGRSTSMCVNAIGFESQSGDGNSQPMSPTSRPTHGSVFGILDGTAEPTSSRTSRPTSLIRTRSSSEAPVRRRADHELLSASGPQSNNAVGEWGFGVDLDEYYVGADGVFYPKSTSLVMYQQDWRLVVAAKVMALIYASNSLLSPRNRLPLTEFYNELIDDIDLIADYDTWQVKCQGSFSFCQYPFLLSLKAKIQIMQVDAARQMDVKLKEAVISALFQSYQHHGLPAQQPHLKLLVRRRCLVEDSLHQLASHEQDLKKRLKIQFVGEEGIDAGGLAKEWFMLLVRELMNPMYGMFTHEPDSPTSAFWFNPASLEASNQYFLVGIVIGLALYNSIILDLHLPLVVYKKLLYTKLYPSPSNPQVSSVSLSLVDGNNGVQRNVSASNSAMAGVNSLSNGSRGPYGPSSTTPKIGAKISVSAASSSTTDVSGSPVYGLLSQSAQVRYQINEMLADVSEFRPQLARGLRQLLQYKGDDVEDVFCLSFEASYEVYGEVVTVQLMPNGSNIPVTNVNRIEYVLRYLQWILNDSIAKQFEPFRRGFYYVCGGNALSLFKPEEIELMVHGSATDWDPDQLQNITEYVNFGKVRKIGKHASDVVIDGPGADLVRWFWEILREMDPKDRRAFLAFVTGTDRMPTIANTSLKLKLVLLGPEHNRLPIAHTCFNQLGLWQYRTRDELSSKLYMAIKESEGFGLQ